MMDIDEEIKKCNYYWDTINEALDRSLKAETTIEELFSVIQSLKDQIKKLTAENQKLQKQLEKQEQKIKSLANSEKELITANKKMKQASKMTYEAKLKMKKVEYLKRTAEDMINIYQQKIFELEQRKDHEQ